MEVVIFNLQRYFLLFLFYKTGSLITHKKTASATSYFSHLLLPISIYAFFEGTRWMRGIDYRYNYDIANCKVTSGDIAYDGLAQILHYIGFPYWVFFILISTLLITSLMYLCKNYKAAFFPCMTILYAFTMNQSENLMRQYTAISCLLLSFALYYNNNYKWAILWFAIGYFCHSSLVFIIPFFLISICLYKYLSNSKLFSYIPFLFLLLYLCSNIIENYYLYFLQNISPTELMIASKYTTETYLSRATDNTMAETIINNSILETIRSHWRAVTIIISGYYIFPKAPTKDHIKFLFTSYCIGCMGYIYSASLPTLTMEVIARLGLYLDVFAWFFEGFVIYYFLIKKSHNNTINSSFKLMRWAVIVLVLMEAVWILKPREAGVLGLNFIWS